MTQGTQGLLGEREEQLGVSDRGVIKFRKIVLDAIETALKGGTPKGIAAERSGDGHHAFGYGGGSEAEI